MRKLIECVEITRAGNTYLLKPKPENEIDLVMLGFTGTEKWIRLMCDPASRTKDLWNYEVTIMKADGKSWGWHWGYSGHTLVTDGVWSMGQKIVDACKIYSAQKGDMFPGKGW